MTTARRDHAPPEEGRYRALFIAEARRTLSEISTVLATVAPPDPAHLMRLFHTLKGMGATMRIGPIVELAHAVEDLVEQVRLGFLVYDSGEITLVRAAILRLLSVVDAVEAGEDPPDADLLAERIRSHVRANVRTEFRLLPARAGQAPAPAEPQGPGATFAQLIGAVERLRARAGDHPASLAELETIERTARALHAELSDLREEPLGTVVAPLRVRLAAICEDLGRQARLEVVGERVRIDSALLGPLQAAIVHLLHNAVAHGIEPAAQRAAKGPVGRVLLAAERREGLLRVSVTDDGRGLDADQLRAAALDPFADAAELARRPGVSTVTTAGDIAGRGLGLAAVEHLVAGIGGRMQVFSTAGEGTTVTLEVPLPGDALPSRNTLGLTRPYSPSPPRKSG